MSVNETKSDTFLWLGGVDYQYISNKIQFSRQSSFRFLYVNITDDDVAEPTEEFSIKVTKILTGGISLATGKATKVHGIIIDNDGKFCYLSYFAYERHQRQKCANK